MVGDPGGQLPDTQVRVLSGGGQNYRLFLSAESIPGDSSILDGALQLPLLLGSPSVIGALGYLQLGQ
jgi:hypothetical protein